MDRQTKRQAKLATRATDPTVTVRWGQDRTESGPTSQSTGSEDTPASARTLLRLLQATALASSGHGWKDVLYTVFVGALITAGSATFVFADVAYGLILLRTGRSLVYIASLTAFFGVQFVLMWLSLMTCFVASRRPYGELLLTIGNLLQSKVLQGYGVSARRLRKRFNWLLCAVIGLMIITCGMATRGMPWMQFCNTFSVYCLVAVVFGLLFWLFCFSAFLISFKLVFAALQISTGFSAINLELQAVIDGDRLPDRQELCQLRSLQDQLSRAFTRLTGVMAPELVMLMLSGTLQLIAILMLLIGTVEAGEFVKYAEVMLMYLFGATVAVAVPCEMTQRVLNVVGETRDLLLRSEWQRPELAPELSLFRETVGRDLATLGDLGLFRLQRPTLLAVAATVLTYVIVLAQFFVTELTTNAPENMDPTNATDIER